MQADESISKTNLPNSNGLNNIVESNDLETATNQPPINEEETLKTANGSFKPVNGEPQTLEANLTNNNDQNDQIVIENGLNRVSPNCEPISDKSINTVNNSICNTDCTTNGDTNCTDKSTDELKHNQNSESNKAANDLSSDSVNHKSNQEILNTISTSNATNELITTTCTNVTLLTAN